MPAPRPPLDRRRILVGLAVLAGGVAAVASFRLSRLWGPRRRSHESAERLLLSCFPEPEPIRTVGGSYLEARPDEADRRRLLDLLLADLEARAPLGSDAEVRRSLFDLVREDYSAGRTLRLEGWVVSRTEGRLAALVALAGPAAASR